MASTEQPIIIKKKRRGGHHGHHGGAWKVAYADFVTAMMAFFLVMWILGLSEPSKKHLAKFFRDPGLMEASAGSRIPMDVQLQSGSEGEEGNGAGTEGVRDNDGKVFRDAASASIPESVRESMVKAAYSDSIRIAENTRLAMARIREAQQVMMEKSPEMRETVKNMIITLDNEALRIELVEVKDNLFFNPGSDVLKPLAIKLLGVIASYLTKLENHVYIEGHTDAKQYQGSLGGFSNWDLSGNRANAARRILETNGLWADQITHVVACADKRPINPDNPFDPVNRRVTIVIPMEKQSDILRSKIQDYLETQGITSPRGTTAATTTAPSSQR
jgi:chemotaxis protein MotB